MTYCIPPGGTPGGGWHDKRYLPPLTPNRVSPTCNCETPTTKSLKTFRRPHACRRTPSRAGKTVRVNNAVNKGGGFDLLASLEVGLSRGRDLQMNDLSELLMWRRLGVWLVDRVEERTKERDQARGAARAMWMDRSYAEKEAYNKSQTEWLRDTCPWLKDDE